jgi:hypothetical protein
LKAFCYAFIDTAGISHYSHLFLLYGHHECIIAELQDLIENWNVLTNYVEDGLSAGA